MKKINRGIITALSSIGIAQALKILTHKQKTGKWDIGQINSTGGMPSSHSSGVSALITYLALNKGWNHSETALATVFGVIVMYDAQGIRRHTGEIAHLVNQLEDKFAGLSQTVPDFEYIANEKELKELLGHQPFEVLGGAMLGASLGLFSAWYENKNKENDDILKDNID